MYFGSARKVRKQAFCFRQMDNPFTKDDARED